MIYVLACEIFVLFGNFSWYISSLNDFFRVQFHYLFTELLKVIKSRKNVIVVLLMVSVISLMLGLLLNFFIAISTGFSLISKRSFKTEAWSGKDKPCTNRRNISEIYEQNICHLIKFFLSSIRLMIFGKQKLYGFPKLSVILDVFGI